MHIRWLWSQLHQVEHNILWVKAHQDQETPYELLPRNAQLNTVADQLATQYMSEGRAAILPPRSKNPMLFPITLVVNGQRVTAHIKDTIRYHINGTRMQAHMQKRNLWSDKVWTTIEFYSFGKAYKSSDFPNKICISKIAHGWLNTGQQRKNINLGANDSCPSCGTANETQEQVLRCPHGNIMAKRYNCLTKLRAKITLTKGSLLTWTTLCNALTQWLDGLEIPTLTLPTQEISPTLRSHLIKVFQAQTAIGWKHVTRRYLSSNWSLAQLQEHPKSSLAGIQTQWTQGSLEFLW